MDKLNILYISRGGGRYFSNNVYDMKLHGAAEPMFELANMGHNIYLLGTSSDNTSHQAYFNNINVYRCKPFLKSSKFGFSESFPLYYLRKIINDFNIDLINGRGVQNLNVLFSAIYSRVFTSVPFVLSIIGNSITTNNLNLDILCNLYDHSLGKILVKSSKKVIILSNESLNRAKMLGVPDEKICISPIGVNTRRFNPNKYNAAFIKNYLDLGNKFVIGFVGRFVNLKGIIDLIKAANIVNRKYSIHLLLVGDGPLKKEIDRISHSLGIPLTITGWVRDPEKYYSVMDVFVLPSYSEGFPRTCLEAMAMKKTLIVTDVGANREIVEDGVNGFLVNPGNPEVLAEKIMMLIENKALLEDWGHINRNIVEKNYTLDKEVKTLEEIYYNVIQSYD